MKRTFVTCCVGLAVILAGYVKTASNKMHRADVNRITIVAVR